MVRKLLFWPWNLSLDLTISYLSRWWIPDNISLGSQCSFLCGLLVFDESCSLLHIWDISAVFRPILKVTLSWFLIENQKPSFYLVEGLIVIINDAMWEICTGQILLSPAWNVINQSSVNGETRVSERTSLVQTFLGHRHTAKTKCSLESPFFFTRTSCLLVISQFKDERKDFYHILICFYFFFPLWDLWTSTDPVKYNTFQKYKIFLTTCLAVQPMIFFSFHP